MKYTHTKKDIFPQREIKRANVYIVKMDVCN